MNTYFSSSFDRSDEYAHNYHNINKLRAELANIEKGTTEENCKIIKESEKRMLELFKPQNWNVNRKNNLEIEFEVGFEKFVISVEKAIGKNLKGATLFEFQSALQFIKDNSRKDG